MTATPYRSASEVLQARIEWTRAVLGRVIADARTAGWLEGDASVVAPSPDSVRDRIRESIASTSANVDVMPVEWLASRLGLLAAELDALWLLVCCEIDPGLARLAQVVPATSGTEMALQSWRIAANAAGIVLQEAMIENLERLRLIELMSDARVSHARRPVRATDRVLEIVRGELRLAAEIASLCGLSFDTTEQDTAPQLRRSFTSSPSPWIVATGPRGAGRSTCMRSLAAAHKLGVLRVDCAGLSVERDVLIRQVRAVVREACLFGVTPLFEDLDANGQAVEVIDSTCGHFTGPILGTSRTAPRVQRRPVIVHPMRTPKVERRAQIWREMLVNASEDVVAAAADLALWPGTVVAAAGNARAAAGIDVVTVEHVRDGVRAALGDLLDGIATRVEITQSWDDLVLPPDQFEQVVELVSRVRNRRTVLETWGLGDKIGKGRGITALFSGPPGTGKTMAAGLVAKELGLDLYQIDLSKIVSKYIGETEKQLAAVFDAAESGHIALLFDEADSLFGKRSEVKSSNDRYANLEVNYLLQRIESFNGIAMLTTNHESAIDDAFRRRLAIHVRFPVPECEERENLWRSMVPKRANLAADVDPGRLAREFEMSGGHIKNAVLRAAYLAADESSAISMAHLWRAARAEYHAIGKIVRE